MTPYLLAALAVLLAGPVPALMSRWTWMRRTPFAAILLWQSVAMAAVLAAVGAGLATVTWWSHGSPSSLAAFGVALLALALTGVVVGRLLLSGHRVGVQLRAVRRRHREQLDLVSTRSGSGRVLVVDHDVPVAYCLPSMAQPRVVLSAGAVQRLAPAELSAVFAHERAHLSARHDLVLEAFTVLHRAFPRWVSSDAALREVKLLVEVLADRAALRVGTAADLGRALLTMAEGRAPAGAMGAAHASARGELVARVQLLADRRPRPLQAMALAGAAWCLVVLPSALVVAPWLLSL